MFTHSLFTFHILQIVPQSYSVNEPLKPISPIR